MNFHKNHWLLFSVIFFGFIGLSFLVGIAPAMWVQSHSEPLPGAEPLSALEQRGLEVYISEGCVSCHTQQVRALEVDEVWGRPAAPGDYFYVEPLGPWSPYAPAVLGSERTGPDLTTVGSRQSSETWQYMHLYNPRSVVADSVMPAYPWLFKETGTPAAEAVVVPVPDSHAPQSGAQVVATDKAQALIAYLLSLKQVSLEGAEAEAPPPEAAQSGEAAPAASSPVPADAELGASVYSNNCASCHQASGEGLPGTFPPLAGDPVATAEDPGEHIATVLNGKQGSTIDGVTYSSPMPAFAAQLSDAEIAAVINHERTSWGNSAPTVTPEDVAEARKGGE